MKNVILAGGGTGGHLYPALALGAALQELDPAVQVHYVGAQRGVESRVLPEKGLPHTLLPMRGFQRDGLLQNWRLVPALGGTFLGLFRLFRRLRPALVVGTGGYASGPAGLYAVLTGVPLALQEQNSHAGAVTRVLSRRARQVHLGFPEAASQLEPGARTEILSLGNPIQAPDTSIDRLASRRRFGLAEDAVVLLVVGGSQGARAINEALVGAIEGVVRGDLPARPEKLEVLWATGPTHIEGISERLRPLGADWVKAVGYIDAMPQALAATDVAVSRAGAMGTAELLAWGRPMILVPLPTAAADHQTHNARALEDAGAAIMLPESEMTSERLWRDMLALTGDADRRARMERAARDRAQPDAAREIARHLHTLMASR
ncbi:MAG TPA: undecaprenyldiphospho-muramoylpentapeptide beta-N-acetylglucosaminyltransferase [Longimicrobiales bacterium]|nr:undecaprenyldiphospho-muramoylpentapeptide beta-N-acetylglucosaminyltransferase [Longimicrobiales bacterium]